MAKKNINKIPKGNSPQHLPGKIPANSPGSKVVQPGKRIKLTEDEFNRLAFAGVKIDSLHIQLSVNREKYLWYFTTKFIYIIYS